MPPVQKILFLCMGNICRSPAGHCVFQHLVDQAGHTQRFEIESAGTIGFHVGAAPDQRMQQSMRARQIPIIGRARQLVAADLEYYDLILAMDHANLADARRLDPSGALHHKLQLFCNYCTQHSEAEVPDPYYGGEQGFEQVLNIVEDGCANLLQQLTT
jgi:protein-tyrosine phosphatase